MILLECLEVFSEKKRLEFAKKDYDDLFCALIDFCYRVVEGGMVLDADHLDGIAGQELNIKDEFCRNLYVLFVFLVSNALNPIYILAVLEDYFFELYLVQFDKFSPLPISRIYVMYLLLETFLRDNCCGILPKAKKIADLAITMCSSAVCEYCFRVCELISDLEGDRDACEEI